MKIIAVIFVLILFALGAGCSTVQSNIPTIPQTQTSVNDPKTISDSGISFILTVDKMKFDISQSNNNVHYLIVYITLKNIGNKAEGLDCFSTISDYGGMNSGGIGTGTAGVVYPGNSQSIHQGLLVYNQQYDAIMSKPSKLSVSCLSTDPFATSYSKNLKASWDVKPSDFQ